MFSFEKIKFKKILLKDLKRIFIWRNDSFIRSKMLNQKKISYKEHLSWYKNLQRSNTQKSYIIYYKSVPIGLASIKEIDPINQTCTWGFYIANKLGLGLGLKVGLGLKLGLGLGLKVGLGLKLGLGLSLVPLSSFSKNSK